MTIISISQNNHTRGVDDDGHLLVEFNILHDFQCKGIVSKEDMHAEKTNDAEITQHPV